MVVRPPDSCQARELPSISAVNNRAQSLPQIDQFVPVDICGLRKQLHNFGLPLLARKNLEKRFQIIDGGPFRA